MPGLIAGLLGLVIAASPAAAAPGSKGGGTDTCRGQDTEVIEAGDIELAERSLLCLVNVHRASRDRMPLAMDPDLAAVARAHSEDMVDRGFYAHTNPDGETEADRAAAAGYEGSVGENIYWRTVAQGVSPLQFFTGWEAIAENNKAMLRSSYRVAGMGLALGGPEQGREGRTATQLFGTTRTDARDTALDLLIPAACPPARKALKRAKAKLAEAKAEGVGVKRAARKVKKKKKVRKRACNPKRF